MAATIIFDDLAGTYKVEFPYSFDTVERLKRFIPAADRAFDRENKCWHVSPNRNNELEVLFPGVTVPAAVIGSVPIPEQYEINLRYLGRAKRGGMSSEGSAFGYAQGNWSVIFPESVLRQWFEGAESEGNLDSHTLYGVLGVKNFAEANEIKTGYRRMVKQWHPDVCNEPNAQEMFLKVQEAYKILSGGDAKTRYDVGLKFTLMDTGIKEEVSYDEYRTPLFCGLVTVLAVESLSKLRVSKILKWEDIKNGRGETLVTSWPRNGYEPVEVWI